MASSWSEVHLTCPVCFDIFKDPVILKCSHSICEACLQKFWEKLRSGDCPICRRSSTEFPPPNLALKNLCEDFLKNRIKKPASPSASLCSLHGERLKLFCVNDEELICAICQTSKKHQKHKLQPIQEAALKYKEEVEKALRPLEEKLKAFTEAKQKNDREDELIKSQAQSTEMQIQKEFEELHQFLRDEEAARIAALREEKEQMSQVSDPEVVSGGRIDVAKHLGNLKYRVWEKMQGIAQYTPVVLNPNIKSDNLTVSEDLTSLRYSGETELRSEDDDDDDDDDDDIFKSFGLGSEGFLSGTHYWDVEVGDNPAWVLGVAEKGEAKLGERWAIGHNDDDYKVMSSAGKTTKLKIKKEVKKVRVQLDWDKGRVSFSDPTNNTSLHTLKHKFTERLFPVFGIGSDCVPLRICPLQVSVTVG
ncbi:hypothetical protein SKAU_G00076530 [Synaphobranchus kaupii]|uniref:Nuclear factor 7, brain-like n=1 Tax=Synaphobranchus kaupii TaxID=118154 RepID=A0A9Q1JBT6_SYNKA|nr:hypothetical protein SKAU_G00076530 [Synaphobranchus kaupii]